MASVDERTRSEPYGATMNRATWIGGDHTHLCRY